MEESEHPSLGSEDGTIDVERMLVEPQDEHLSMDRVMCFNEKIPKTAISIEDVSRCSGESDTGIAREGKDILSGEVHNAIPSEVGYLRLENDFCSMGEEYRLGVEFAESITNLDYGSSEGLQASVSDNQVQVSTSGSNTACRSDNLREYHNDLFKFGSSELNDTPLRHEFETSSGENPTISPRSCTPQTSVKSQNSSSSSCQDVLSDENDGRFSQDGNMFCDATNVIKGREELLASVQASSTNVLPTQKRSRKPTQRYIESVQPVSTYPKKRREISSIAKDKSLGPKDHKKCHVGPKAIREPPEDFSVVAIQVPFGSLANKECSMRHACDMVQRVDCVTTHKQSKLDRYATPVDHLKKCGDCRTDQKKIDDCSTEAQSIDVVRKRRSDRIPAHRKKRDDSLTGGSSEEVSGRRKHHRVWSISEVRKLIDGVSQYGVGRWSRIKKLFFSASAHRTSVDLKDKWRNLLKASGMQENGSHLQGEKKRSMAWRPLPESILRRVCELAAVYPYPKGQRTKVARIIQRRSPDTSTDITLSDYRRILRSMNAN